MSVTVFSFFMAFLISSVFICIVHLLRNNTAFLKGFGVPAILLLYGICICRMALPVEFAFTIPVRMNREYDGLFHKATTQSFHVAGMEMGLFEIIGFSWLLISLAILLVCAIDYIHSFIWLQRFENYRCPRAEEIFSEIRERFGGQRKIRIFVYPRAESPMSVGVFRKCILLPKPNYTDKELYYGLAHEYIHILNHDQIVKVLLGLFFCVFWWNPLVYLLWMDLEQMLEFKCDLTLWQYFTDVEQSEYLDILAAFAQELPKHKRFRIMSLLSMRMSKRGYSKTVERIKFLAVPPTKQIVAAAQAAFFSLCMVLTVVSYIFVLQPYYEPPAEDIYTDTTVIGDNWSEGYILKHKDGSYSFVSKTGKIYDMNEENLGLFLEGGYELKEE